MENTYDFSVDELADAALTADQRRAWVRVRGELASEIAKNQSLREQLRQLEQKLSEPLLPSVLNRADFNREVARMLAFDERYGGISSIIYFDFEGLDEVKTRFGDAVSMSVLTEIAMVLTRGVRSSDIVGRLTPDEFGILLMRCDNGSAWRKAEAMSKTLQQAFEKIQDGQLNVGISYGAYTFRDNDNLSVGLKEAAQVMMCGKRKP